MISEFVIPGISWFCFRHQFREFPAISWFWIQKRKKKKNLEKFSGFFFSCLMICYCSISYSNIWTIKFLLNLLHEYCPDKFQHSTCFSTHYCSHRDRLIYPHCSTHIASILKETVDLIQSENPKSLSFYIHLLHGYCTALLACHVTMLHSLYALPTQLSYTCSTQQTTRCVYCVALSKSSVYHLECWEDLQCAERKSRKEA